MWLTNMLTTRLFQRMRTSLVNYGIIKLSYARREAPRIFSCEAENMFKPSYARGEALRIFSCEAENIAKLI